MPDSEDPKQVSSNDLRNSQFGGGLINAENVNTNQIGNNTYNNCTFYNGQQISEAVIDPSQMQVAKTDYLKQIRIIVNNITLADLDLGEDRVNKHRPIENLFVMPYIEKRANYIGKEINQKYEQKILAQKAFEDEQNRFILLLGTPGSGKTTLINYFVLSLCGHKLNSKTESTNNISNNSYKKRLLPKNIGLSNEIDWLPIIIRIREMSFHPEMSILDFARYSAEKHLSCSPLPHNFFESWLKDGRAVIFFDGLDEVEKEQQRQIRERIKTFLEKYDRNRAIITSRPVGNIESYFQEKDFSIYLVQSFEKAQIYSFINFWYNNYFSNQAEADSRKVNFKKALFASERIQKLAHNPLLLTILLTIHRDHAQLPKERCELYNCAIDILLNKWDENKKLKNYEILQYLKVDDLRWMMARLAYWIHTQGKLTNQEAGSLIDRNTLVEQLSEYIKVEKRIKYYEAEAEAKRFLDEIVADRTGLLILQGGGSYAFVHRTFQEYLTAEDICNRAKEYKELDIFSSEIQPHLHNSYWHEVILLLVAQLTGKRAAQVIHTIFYNRSEYERWLHRDLLFVGRCLGENPKQLQEIQENSKLVTEILTQLIKLELSNSFCVGWKTKQLISDILLNLSGTFWATEALQILNKYASRNNSSNKILMYQLALGEHQEVIHYFIGLLKNKHLYQQTINILKKVVIYSNISDFLIGGLRSDFHGEVGIAKALRELGYNDEDVYLSLLEEDYDEMYNDINYKEHLESEAEDIGIIFDF